MDFRFPRYFLILASTYFILSFQYVGAQPLSPAIKLTQPGLHQANALSQLQVPDSSVIGIFYANASVEPGTVQDSILAESVLQWEYLLVGLKLPYTLLTDTTFSEDAIQPLRLLIVPKVNILADSSLTVIHDYVKDGGGLIASGAYAETSRGACESTGQLSRLIGASRMSAVGDVSNRIAQALVGDSPLLQGVPAGFELDILPAPLCTVSIGEGKAAGYYVTDEGEELSLIVSNQVGEGRVVWTGFGPQDIPPDGMQQKRYQGVILNALVYTTNTASIEIQKWPYGNQSATALMQLPSSGYQPFSYRTSTDLLLNALDSTSTPGTFFLVSRHAKDHPDLIHRMARQGEIALVGDTQKPLAGLRPELQQERLAAGKSHIESMAGATIRGVLPPGYFYDANTLHALVDLNIDYMLSGSGALIEPAFMPWPEELDYRDSLLIVSDSSIPYEETGQEPLVRLQPVLYSYDLDSPVSDEPVSIASVSLQERWAFRLNRSFEDIHQSGGLFIFAYEPEAMGLTLERASLLKEFGNRLKKTNTWSATLGEIVRWWRLRDRITVKIEQFSEEEVSLVITNQNQVPVRGVSLAGVFPGFEWEKAMLNQTALDVKRSNAGERQLLHIEVLPAGSHTIRWEVPGSAAEKVEIP